MNLAAALLIFNVLNAGGTAALNADKIAEVIKAHIALHGDRPTTMLGDEHAAAVTAAATDAVSVLSEAKAANAAANADAASAVVS